MENLWNNALIKDDQLRMMFTCCHPGISQENQVTLILKTLCGFSTSEIAKAFLTSEDTVSKRLYRAKDFFRQHKIQFIIPNVDELKSRTETVLNAVYLLFNEGYNSTEKKELIRQDLIDEAMLLGKLLAENMHTQLPEVYALMALMCFHSARSESRLTAEGEIILLPYQDRSKWNQELIKMGNDYMNQAAFGDNISTYHLEAAIAYEHCTAGSFGNTNWQLILEWYNYLCNISLSPITALNRIVAVMQVHGAEKALQQIEEIEEKKKLEAFYLYHALLGEIYTRLNQLVKAKEYFETAIRLTKSEAERKVLKEKIVSVMN
jgi:RNA polymerase sigma-70 factor (ECF subfamily)